MKYVAIRWRKNEMGGQAREKQKCRSCLEGYMAWSRDYFFGLLCNPYSPVLLTREKSFRFESIEWSWLPVCSRNGNKYVRSLQRRFCTRNTYLDAPSMALLRHTFRVCTVSNSDHFRAQNQAIGMFLMLCSGIRSSCDNWTLSVQMERGRRILCGKSGRRFRIACISSSWRHYGIPLKSSHCYVDLRYLPLLLPLR